MGILWIFQWMVDASQKEPHWWGRQCCKGEFVAFVGLVYWVTTESEWWLWVALMFAGAGVIASYYLSSSAAAFATLKMHPKPFLVMEIGLAALNLVELLVSPHIRCASLFGIMFFGACTVLFAKCRPPAPPTHRFSPVGG